MSGGPQNGRYRRGAQLGILIKGPEVLESTRRVNTVLLDKAGTVTTGQMTLPDVIPGRGVRGIVEGLTVTVGRSSLVSDEGFVLPVDLRQATSAAVVWYR